jgi:hypothetical protein
VAVGSLAGEPGQSLGVRLTGARAGVWADFSSGERGDALDLVAAVLCGGDKVEAMRWARRWLGIGATAATDVVPVRSAPVPTGAARDAETEARRRKAVAVFGQTWEPITGTPAAEYLAGRGLDFRELGRVPRARRFHASCWCAEAGRALPAMLAAITGLDGTHLAKHRAWLAPRPDGTSGKAPLDRPKKVLGSFAGGSICLWRGASGRPLSEAEPGEAVPLVEGIETALSVAFAAPELRVLCAISVGNLRRVELPPTVSAVILCVDNDEGNDAAERALARAVDHFRSERREVRVARPPAGVKDLNDVLTAENPAT